MRNNSSDFWTDNTSVLFSSFWGWSPETWGAIGWTGKRGEGRRRNLLAKLSDPFVAVIYVTGTPQDDEELKGRIAGFYLVSHEAGDRDQFMDSIHHSLEPDKWRHSLRAIRAFSYLPEHRLAVSDLDPSLLDRARSVSGMGEVITDSAQIRLLKTTPWIEVDIYCRQGDSLAEEEVMEPSRGFTRAGPANQKGYFVSTSAQELERQLYILRLEGSTDAYLGEDAAGRHIYKIGLSVSPEMRRLTFQKWMPRGAFRWSVFKTSGDEDTKMAASFEAAVAGENAMKVHLARCADWLGGEFYLASESDVREAWQLGLRAVEAF